MKLAQATSVTTVAGQPGGETLRQRLPADRAQWSELDRREQERIVEAMTASNVGAMSLGMLGAMGAVQG